MDLLDVYVGLRNEIENPEALLQGMQLSPEQKGQCLSAINAATILLQQFSSEKIHYWDPEWREHLRDRIQDIESIVKDDYLFKQISRIEGMVEKEILYNSGGRQYVLSQWAVAKEDMLGRHVQYQFCTDSSAYVRPLASKPLGKFLEPFQQIAWEKAEIRFRNSFGGEVRDVSPDIMQEIRAIGDTAQGLLAIESGNEAIEFGKERHVGLLLHSAYVFLALMVREKNNPELINLAAETQIDIGDDRILGTAEADQDRSNAPDGQDGSDIPRS